MKSITRTAAILTVLVAPLLASAQIPPSTYVQGVTTGYTTGFISTSGGFGTFGMGTCANGTIVCVAQTILYLINAVLVPVLFAIAFIVFLYGVFKTYIWSRGDETEVEKGHKLIFWGIIGFVVMISLWGLVNVVANTFGLWGYVAPHTPTSY